MSLCTKSTRIFVNGKAVFKSCGKCALCRSAFANELSFRFRKDIEMWNEVYPELCRTFFLTLTYDEDHVPTVVDEADPDRKFNYLPGVHKTLRHEDLFKWKERIRSQLERSLKKDLEKYGLKRLPLMIVSSGEYGDGTHRPHYHVVIHGIPCSYGSVADCWLLFSKKWCNEKGEQLGFVRSELVRTDRSVHYTTKYSTAALDCSVPACCEKPKVQYGKGIGNVYFSRKYRSLIEKGGIPDSYYDKERCKEVFYLRRFPKYFVRKYLTPHKFSKESVYKRNMVNELKGFVKQYGFSSPTRGSFEEFAEASWKLLRIKTLLDKVRIHLKTLKYLEHFPFTMKSWKLFGRGEFSLVRIISDDKLYERFIRDSKLEHLLIERYDGHKEHDGCLPITLSHVARVLRWSDRRCRNLENFYEAVSIHYLRVLEDYCDKYSGFLDVYSRHCKYLEDASIQAQRDLEANFRKDKI